MKIESIFRKIPDFQNIVLDKILFESKYPVLFTCKNNKDVYLFICCFAGAEKIEWIGTKTSYENLIDLLENRVTIRDAFFNVTKDKILISYGNQKIQYKVEDRHNIPEKLLPTAGEYMDAEEDEYTEEISDFKRRSLNIEYLIKPGISKYLEFYYIGSLTVRADAYFDANLNSEDVWKYKIEKLSDRKIVFA